MKHHAAFLLFLLLGLQAHTQENITFQQPSSEILALADYQRSPVVRNRPATNCVLFMYRPRYKSLEELGQEAIRLAGMRINAKAKISSTDTYYNELRLKALTGTEEILVKGLP